MSAFARVAHIAKTRNLEGSVVVHGIDGLPFLLSKGMLVHFVPPTLRGPRSACVESVQQIKEDAFEVKFEGVDSIESAEALAGSYCLVSKSDLPSLVQQDAPQTLLGFSVEDEAHGYLGEVVEVLTSSAQGVLVVEGPFGEVMIPVVDEFIAGLDESTRLVRVCIPSGLLNLNEA